MLNSQLQAADPALLFMMAWLWNLPIVLQHTLRTSKCSFTPCPANSCFSLFIAAPPLVFLMSSFISHSSLSFPFLALHMSCTPRSPSFSPHLNLCCLLESSTGEDWLFFFFWDMLAFSLSLSAHYHVCCNQDAGLRPLRQHFECLLLAT